MKSLFTVGGKPFLSLGGQVSNSSAYTRADLQPALDGIEALGMNTIAAPVYWECMEPEEGRYCFDQAEGIIDEARKRGLKAVLLWFGTWKNGNSHYVPRWIKEDRQRFPSCITPSGKPTATLSPFGAETLRKDQEAFCRLMGYIRDHNGDETVIAVQVQNEAGHLGTPRDCGEAAQAAFDAPIPQEVSRWLQTLSSGLVWEAWQRAGGKANASWRDTFGFEASELFSAYHVAGYINAVAGAGKAVYPLPMYTNAWMQENQTRIPGLDYPSGGPTTLALDLWKRFTPALDALCPDIYAGDYVTYERTSGIYHREDNLLYISESRADANNARNLLIAMGKHHLTGIHVFGVEKVFDQEGGLNGPARDFKDAVTILNSMEPMIRKYHGTGRLFTVAQNDRSTDWIDFGDYIGMIEYYSGNHSTPLVLDCFHDLGAERRKQGKGIIVYEGNGSFYLAGCGFRMIPIKKTTPEEMIDAITAMRFLYTRNLWYLEAAEGRFDENGVFVPHRRRNGDETDHSVWTAADVGVIHLQLL